MGARRSGRAPTRGCPYGICASLLVRLFNKRETQSAKGEINRMPLAKLNVYLESGKKRIFACAPDWPGWCRSGRNEDAALQALVDSAARYAQILAHTGLVFQSPTDVAALTVVERVEGTQTTDFGAPDVAPTADTLPIDETDLQRLQTLLQAYWSAFDATVQAAEGKTLRLGPRGGGRDLADIVQHVQGAEASYLARLAWKYKKSETGDVNDEITRTREAVLQALTAAAHGETPARGPRGGVIWPPRYFVRRVGWHVLDHIWEIEDRVS